MPRRLTLLLFALTTLPAHAVLVRGHVTTPLGQPLPGARVQLIALSGRPHPVASGIAGPDGSYELSAGLAGRFLLIASPSVTTPNFAPQIGNAFYAGHTDLLVFEIALNPSQITPELSAQANLIDTPSAQLSAATTQIRADQLLTDATPLPELRAIPGAFVVQQGQFGTPATLYLRGAPVTRVLVDEISAEDLGGPFNLGAFTSSALSAIASTPAIELTPTANPLHGLDATAGVLSFAMPVATDLHPLMIYTGDAGNLSTTRNEAVLTAVHTRADALVSFARFNTDNDLPAARLHLVTSAANLGYHVSANTSLRLTMRDDVSATPLASPFDFFGVAPATKLAAQNLYSAFTFETRTAGDWHNLLRYGLVRKRAEAFHFTTPATGQTVTITGANGYSTSGIATFLPAPPREDFVTNRDEVTWQTDRPIYRGLTALLTVRYQNERGADRTAASNQALTRTHFSVASAFEGEIHHRFFYAASGLLDHSPTYGFTGAPRLGLTYVPVLPGTRRFRGTSLHFTAATGTREPTLAEAFATRTPIPARSRTLDVSVDQTLLPRKLDLRMTYFHNQFAHESELLSVAPIRLSNALAYRTQGFESDLRYQAAPRLLLHGGYTFLAALVERSAGSASFNPRFPLLPIGALTALAGARPFHRPPQTGFTAAEYTGRVVTASLKASFASRSDDSTGLILNPALLLPNRNLSPSFASVDASATYAFTRSITVYTELENLLDDRHLTPIGYLSTPFSARVGVRLRLGRE